MSTDHSLESPGRRRILIVDDHAVFREGLTKIIDQEADLCVCGEAQNADLALEKTKQLHPELVIVDVSLDGVSGLELTKTLRAHGPDLKILVLSMHKESVYADRALRAGADGYIMKQESGHTLISAIHSVLDGQTYVSTKMNQTLLKTYTRSRGDIPASPVDRLGAREFEVFHLIAKGFGSRQIADELRISIKTVEAHRGHIREKLNLQTSFELTQYAREWSAHEKE